MDKQGKEISIKINGKERPFTTETSTYIEAEISAAKEEEPLALEAPPLVSFPSETTPSKKRPKVNRMIKTRVKSAVFSIFMAVIIGTSFGFIVLNVIPEKKEPMSLQKDRSLSAISPASSSKTANVPPSSAAEGNTESAFTVSVIQAGVFSDEKAAKTYAKQLQNSGIPIVVAVGQQPISLFIAVGADKETLQPLNDWYKQKGQSTYMKSLSLGTVNDRQLQDFLTASESLYEKVAVLSARLLGKGEVKPNEWASLKNAYKQFESQSPSNNQTKQYVRHLKNAYLSLDAYQEEEDDALLWKAQQELLEALNDYISLTS
ncbi:stage II sporulation protein B [Thermaerobacillus caldiproteolyticus]|uniref:stage II sporulation protein B n=1 Tax=Thermaerobacillus caldiproteolyticus TaxID=247480 RepID=UPI0018F1FBFA|nr:stage II sporulation protein B [Anoxybacillus caldiproteolyticus]